MAAKPLSGEEQRRIKEKTKESFPYFKHDPMFHDSQPAKRLLYRYGMRGYGIFWHLCERLVTNHGHTISVEEQEDLEIMAREYEFSSVEALMKFLKDLADLSLLAMPGDGTISSPMIDANADEVARKSVMGQRGGAPKKNKGLKDTTDRTVTL